MFLLFILSSLHHSAASLERFFFSLSRSFFPQQLAALLLLRCPRPATLAAPSSAAATPFSADVCLILTGVVWPGLAVCGVMPRDFQLMGCGGGGSGGGGGGWLKN